MAVLDWDEYQNFRLRATATPLPRALFYDQTIAPIPNPLDPPPEYAPVPGFANIILPDFPTAPNKVEFWSAAPLTQASSLFDDLVFPAGYYEYLLYGTCIRVYPRYGRPVDATVTGLYDEARLASCKWTADCRAHRPAIGTAGLTRFWGAQGKPHRA
jgi:hypothetical protein